MINVRDLFVSLYAFARSRGFLNRRQNWGYGGDRRNGRDRRNRRRSRRLSDSQ